MGARHRSGQGERRVGTDQVDHQIHAAAPAQIHDCLSRSVIRFYALIRSKSQRVSESAFGAVNREDGSRGEQFQELDGICAEPANSDNERG